MLTLACRLKSVGKKRKEVSPGKDQVKSRGQALIAFPFTYRKSAACVYSFAKLQYFFHRLGFATPLIIDFSQQRCWL